MVSDELRRDFARRCFRRTGGIPAGYVEDLAEAYARKSTSKSPKPSKQREAKNGASDRNRTDDNHVGNVMLYQLSYTRIKALIEKMERVIGIEPTTITLAT